MTMSAILRVGEGSGLNKIIAFHRRIPGHSKLVCAKPVVVGSTNLIGVFFARCILVGSSLNGAHQKAQSRGEYGHDKKGAQEMSLHMRFFKVI
jgi:hypothetical protein